MKKVFRFRMISNEEEDFLRDFEILEDQTFLQFHHSIQDNLHYDRSQIASFFLCNKDWEKEKEITLFEIMDEGAPDVLVMDAVTVNELIDEPRQKLLYLFDIFSDRNFFIELLEFADQVEGIGYPVCVKEAGSPPPQIILEQLETDNDMDAFDQYSIDDDNDYMDPEDDGLEFGTFDELDLDDE